MRGMGSAALLEALLLAAGYAAAAAARSPRDATEHKVIWTDLLPEPGKNSEGLDTYYNSMPVGNGHVAANVLYERSSNTLLALISASSAWSEAGELLKVALLEVQLNASVEQAASETFVQTFDPQTASVNFTWGSSSAVVYVDANQDVLFAEFSNPHVAVQARLVSLRPQPTSATPPFDCQAYTTSADVAKGDNVVYHRNAYSGPRSDFMVHTLTVENIPLDGLQDPLYGRATGAQLVADPALQRVGVAVVTAQTSSAEDFEALLSAAADKVPQASTFVAHSQWWADFWSRSYIDIPSEPQLSQMYVLQRCLQAMQARSPFPIKFNGQLFTANRPPNQDSREWGGLNWWQNLRLPYYNMNAAGDSDMLLTLFQQFNSTLPLVHARTKAYFGFDGIWWHEYTHPLYGTTHPAQYGCSRPAGLPIWFNMDDQWNAYNWQGSLDLSLMILDHFAYTQQDEGLLAIPIGVVQFYENLRGNTSDPAGKMIFHPTQALETWQCPGWPPKDNDCATNDAPTIAGLRMVLEKLLRLPGFSADQKAAWSKLLDRTPALPIRDGALIACDDCDTSAPAESPGVHHTGNVENAELYPVHPYRLATVARGDQEALAAAQRAFDQKKFPDDEGWNQNAMDAALLGRAAAAKDYVLKRAATPPAPGYRFPAFSPHLQDYEPSSDHLGVMNSALHYMLSAVSDDEDEGVVLLPAWPCEWDASFRLHAPRRTVVEGQIANGTLTYVVTPPDRAVRVMPCQRTTKEPAWAPLIT